MTPKKKSVADITVLVALAAIYLLVYVFDTIGGQKFQTELSPLVPGGLTFEATNGGPFGYLLTAFIVKTISLVVALVATWIMLTNIKRGLFFSNRTLLATRVIAGAVFVWFVGIFIEHMGNNFAAARLGIEDEWQGPMLMRTATGVLIWILFCILYILERSIKDAMVMQQEVEDLV